jgi:immunoglobulin-binding protein 1
MSDKNDTSAPNGEGLKERYLRGTLLAESSPQEAIPLLESVQKDVVALSLFSSNETVEDVSTKSIAFLSLEHFLALAFTSLPAAPGKMEGRKAHIIRSLDLWSAFLGRMERLELLSNDEIMGYHELMEEVDVSKPMPAPNRDAKIAKFKAAQQAKKEMEHLKALRERRNRYDMAADEEVDGHDEESLERDLALKQLSIYMGEALENWSQSKRELPMIEMMAKMEEERQRTEKHRGGASNQDQRPPPSGKPLQLTRITKDAVGQIQIKRDEVRSKVFRPGWNQPTMSLEELGEREYRQAMEREERQKQAESEQAKQPRRYEDLERDGMEDNAELVDASATLDRDWDDWKNENPRGSGNKHAMRGDKNF